MAAVTHVPSTPRRPSPPLRLVEPHEGGPADRQVGRRWLLVLAAVVLAAATVLASRVLPGAEPSSGATDLPAASEPVTHVVQPGETYWSIAEAAGVGGDVRALVDRLVEQHGDAPLQPGDHLVLPP